MERIYSEIGGRPVLTKDLLTLQNESFESAKALLKDRNAMILNGCVVTGAGPYNISSGVVFINNEMMRFDGAASVTMPYYIYQAANELTSFKPYEVGGSKPTYQVVKAEGSNIMPVGGQYITMTSAGGRKFSESYDAEFVRTVGSQNVAGNKTLSGNNTHSGSNTFTGVTSFTNNVSLSGNVVTNITSTGVVQGTRFTSTVATGTSPMTVTSTTKVNNLNADLLDGYDSTYFTNVDTSLQNSIDALTTTVNSLAVVPSGVILMWSGSVGSIPTGWLLCNGSNGTPDLRNRFIVGAGLSYAVNAMGGMDTVTLNSSQIPSHTHSYVDDYYFENGAPSDPYPGTVTQFVGGNFSGDAGGNENNNTFWGRNKTTGATGGNGSHENRPPYWALCYIMKQ